MEKWQIERLDRSHEREGFCCGKASLDDFLRSRVSQYEKRNLGRTYVALRGGETRVYGYYTLASSALSFDKLPVKMVKKLPKHPVPTALLARLAVDQSVQGTGLGQVLLTDALSRCAQLSKQVGVFAIEVEALDGEAQKFYLKYGFIPLLDSDLHLFLAIKTIVDELD